jgi:thiosulfate/3-mercaptopyruvate sulfurtransferase
MAFRTLISTAALAPRLADPHVVVVDCRYKLDDEAWGAAQYRSGHIPGAAYAHLARDLAGRKTGSNGRHPLPAPDALVRLFSGLGIADGMQVVAYDQDTGMYASRLWWLLRWLGHDAAAVLDGGFAKWIAEKRPTATGDETRAPRDFSGSPRPDMTMDADAVGAAATAPDWRVVDARAPERYRGDIEPIDKVAGHIPGAVNHFYMQNLDDRGIFRSPEELRRQMHPAIGDTPADHIVSYCGSGVTACHNLLALEHAGIHGAKLYPGSWSEWSSDPKRPIGR